MPRATLPLLMPAFTPPRLWPMSRRHYLRRYADIFHTRCRAFVTYATRIFAAMPLFSRLVSAHAPRHDYRHAMAAHAVAADAADTDERG